MAFQCIVCDISFEKSNHLKRHETTQKHHINLNFYNLLRRKSYSDQELHSTLPAETERNPHPCHFEDAVDERCFVDGEEKEEEEIIPDRDDFENDSFSQDHFSKDNDSEWFPFPDKLSLLLYGLLHSPTHHISLEVAKYVWFILKEIGVSNIPSLAKIRNMKFGKLDVEKLIVKGEDDTGLPLYIIKPSEIAKMNLSNPAISENIARCPRKTTVIKEQRDGNRLHEIVSPWATVNNTHFHVGDTVESTANHMIGVIRAFYESDEENVILAEVQVMQENKNENGVSCLEETDRFKTMPIAALSKYIVPSVLEDSSTSTSTLHEKPEKDLPIPEISIPVNVFIDDTSTNVSKRWQPLHCAQIQLAGVPLQYRNNETYSYFLGASEHASVMSISKLILQDIKTTQQIPIEAFDAKMKTCITFRMEVASLIADFNMLSLACNHAGATTLKFCPKCHADKENCITKDRERFPQETMRTMQRLRLRGTEESKKSLKKETGVKDYDNPFWEILNPHRDIPSGVLHLFHLGTSKHLLKVCIELLSEAQISLFESHLSGLDSHQRISFNICKHLNSRQGKDLKKLIQVAPFCLAFAGLSAVYLKTTCLLALINRMVCKEAFDENDIDLLESTVKKYLVLIEENLPQLKNKVKTHLLTHLTDEICRHGPPLGYSEDVFEKRHGVIRAKLFNQENQLARSRDTAILFGKSYLFQHVLMGGFFQTDNDTWSQSTEKVQELAQRKEMRDFMGHLSVKESNSSFESNVPVLLKPTRSDNNKALVEDVSNFHPQCLLLQGLIDLGTPTPSLDGKMITYQSCRTRDGSVIGEGMSMIYINRENEAEIGFFRKGILILMERQREFLVMFEKGNIESTWFLGCPLVKFNNEFDVVPLNRILSYIPLIHHCSISHCFIKEGKTKIRVEQEDKEIHKTFVKHNVNQASRTYLVNIYSLKCPSNFQFADMKTCAKKL